MGALRTFIMQKLLGFTVRRAGTPPCILSREKGVATYFADSHLLLCVAVLLLLRQDFLLLCFGGGALKRLLRLANVCGASEGDTLARAMDFAHYSVFFPCALSTWTLTPEPLTHHHQQFCSEQPFAIGQCRFSEIRKGGMQPKVTSSRGNSSLSRGNPYMD